MVKNTTSNLLDLIKLRTGQRDAYRAEVKRLAAKLQNLSLAAKVEKSSVAGDLREMPRYTEAELYHEVEKLKARLKGVEKQRDALRGLVQKLQVPSVCEEEPTPLL